jgi:hypothetical protein
MIALGCENSGRTDVSDSLFQNCLGFSPMFSFQIFPMPNPEWRWYLSIKSGTDAMLFKYFLRKNWWKSGVFKLKILFCCLQKILNVSLVFEKIAENCHNLDTTTRRDEKKEANVSCQIAT